MLPFAGKATGIHTPLKRPYHYVGPVVLHEPLIGPASCSFHDNCSPLWTVKGSPPTALTRSLKAEGCWCGLIVGHNWSRCKGGRKFNPYSIHIPATYENYIARTISSTEGRVFSCYIRNGYGRSLYSSWLVLFRLRREVAVRTQQFRISFFCWSGVWECTTE
jgi:hypothetical protein